MNRSELRKIRLNSILIPCTRVILRVLVILTSPVWFVLEVLLYIPLMIVKWTVWVLDGRELSFWDWTICGALANINDKFGNLEKTNLRKIPSCDYCRWCAWDEETTHWYCDHPTTPHCVYNTSVEKRLYCFTEKEENE